MECILSVHMKRTAGSTPPQPPPSDVHRAELAEVRTEAKTRVAAAEGKLAQVEAEVCSLKGKFNAVLHNVSLGEAVKRGDVECVELLLQTKEPDDRVAESEPTPLMLAVLLNKRDIAVLLLSAKADPMAVRSTVLHTIDATTRIPTMGYKTRKEERTKDTSPLRIAVDRGNVDMIRMLVERGAVVNGGIGMGTPLHHAAMRAQPATVKALLECKADPLLQDFGGRTAFDWARVFRLNDVAEGNADLQHKEVAKLLSPSPNGYEAQADDIIADLIAFHMAPSASKSTRSPPIDDRRRSSAKVSTPSRRAIEFDIEDSTPESK